MSLCVSGRHQLPAAKLWAPCVISQRLFGWEITPGNAVGFGLRLMWFWSKCVTNLESNTCTKFTFPYTSGPTASCVKTDQTLSLTPVHRPAVGFPGLTSTKAAAGPQQHHSPALTMNQTPCIKHTHAHTETRHTKANFHLCWPSLTRQQTTRGGQIGHFSLNGLPFRPNGGHSRPN